MEQAISWLSNIIWSPALIFLCLGAGLFYSLLTRFAQVRHFFEMWRLLFSGKSSEDGISSFQALAVSLSGRVGMGNIAGVAAGIGFGGPGAIFWMWLVAFLGASTAYVESTLGQIYKERGQLTGQYRGGPAYYFDKCLGQKWYAILLAISLIIACGFFLPGAQANGVVNAVTEVFGEGEMVNTTFFGEVGMNRMIGLAVILLVLGFIIFGGIKRIANFTQVVVPFMALGYIIMSMIIVFANIQMVPDLVRMIVGDAFTAQAGFGAAIMWGVKRGVYSNEAGQGTGPHAASAAEVDHPAQQGLVQAFSVYIDTLFVCSATAFMILITGQYNIQNSLEDEFALNNAPSWIEVDAKKGGVSVKADAYNFAEALKQAQSGQQFSIDIKGKPVATAVISEASVEIDGKDEKAVKVEFTQTYNRQELQDGKAVDVQDSLTDSFSLTANSDVGEASFEPTRFLVMNVEAGTKISSPAFTQKAVSSVFGDFGKTFVAVAVFFFAFTTILAYYYIAETNVAYLGRFFSSGRGALIFLIKVCIMAMVAYGALNSSGYIWGMGDVGVGLTAWLNIVGILLIFFMGRPALKALKDYENQQKAQKGTVARKRDRQYSFDPRKLGIKNAVFWEERANEKNN